MNKQIKKLAYQAIEENVADSTARQIIRYTLECEIFGMDTIQPSNRYLAEKYNWDKKALKEKTRLYTTESAIKLAKKSNFITTTGRGRRRNLELNVGFLKGKMAEIQQKKPLKTNLLEDIGKELGIKEPHKSPHSLPPELPHTLPHTLPHKNTQLDQCHNQKTNYNNNSNNNSNNIREENLEKFSSHIKYEEPPKETYKSKYKIANQKGIRLKKTIKTPKKEKTDKALLAMNKFRQLAMEIHGVTFVGVSKDNAKLRKQFIDAHDKINGEYDKYFNWWFDLGGEYCGYKPNVVFAHDSINSYLAFLAIKPKKDHWSDNPNCEIK